MKTVRPFLRRLLSIAVFLTGVGVACTVAAAATVNATWNSAADVPVTATGYTATGHTINLTLNFAPATGTDLMVVNNTWPGFINGAFNNLTNRQAVVLGYGATQFKFVANYYGGTGNDLVLVWTGNRAFAWGKNNMGQLGDNSQTQRQLPVPVTATGVLEGKTLIALAAGGSHSLALCSDGTVAAWGDNTYGQLGDDSKKSRFVPVAVSTAAGVSALSGKVVVGISAGLEHSLALCSDGTVAAWGRNHYGQLGDNTIFTRQVPVAVNTNSGSALHGQSAVIVVAGWQHSLALRWNGTVVAWGRNVEGQLGDNTGGHTEAQRSSPVAVNTTPILSVLASKMVVGVAAGFSHSLALCSDGTVAAWGHNSYGQLGDYSISTRLVPVAVNTDPFYSALHGKFVTAIAAGGFQSLAACSDGTVASWGRNVSGELGDTTTTSRMMPVAVSTAGGISALAGKTVLATATGYYHSLAFCSDGTVAAWGTNVNGQLGDNSTTSRVIPVEADTVSLADGERFAGVTSSSAAHHTLALVAAPPAPPIALTDASILANGSFQLAFTGAPGEPFTVLAATNPALPLNNWTALTGLTEVSPGQYQFTDSQAAGILQRFYRMRSP
ncbi:MAG TPA: cell wall anchor protein [Candidatus Paceibacterota bacterium]|nr:cell wall anchor protein [Verrucomicrobiota bacterium]HSA10179.1 cell wall anchor protein [Candidatus Paceibacterota bacterium]